MRPEEVRAAVRESADLGQWLGNKAHKLFTMPLEIVAFSDEEGVRWSAPSHSRIDMLLDWLNFINLASFDLCIATSASIMMSLFPKTHVKHSTGDIS